MIRTTKNGMIPGLALATALLAVVPSSKAQDWQAIEFPLTEDITGVCFTSVDTGFVVTKGGQLVYTYDAGRNWYSQQVTKGIPLEDVCFRNSDFGLVCGRNGVLLRTLDGGSYWEDKSLEDTMKWLYDIEMIDDEHGLAIGASSDRDKAFAGLMLRTTDSGRTWKGQEVIGVGYSELFCTPDRPICLLSFGRISCSADKGETWEPTLTVDGKPGRALSLYGKAGIIGGYQGMCAYSRDSGKTWTSVTLSDQYYFGAAQLINDTVGYLGGAPMVILRTSDGGRTWEPEETPLKFHILDFCLVEGRLYAVGLGGGVLVKEVR